MKILSNLPGITASKWGAEDRKPGLSDSCPLCSLLPKPPHASWLARTRLSGSAAQEARPGGPSPRLRGFSRGCGVSPGAAVSHEGSAGAQSASKLLESSSAFILSQAVGRRPSAPCHVGPCPVAARFLQARAVRRQEEVFWQDRVTTLCKSITALMSPTFAVFCWLEASTHPPRMQAGVGGLCEGVNARRGVTGTS